MLYWCWGDTVMYRVAICEDEPVFRTSQEKTCREILERLHIEYNISVFDTSIDFWVAFSCGERYDLLLLDIVMSETNGMELARKIREHDSDATIIFITSNPEYSIQGYDVNALHYLLKPLDSSVLERLITEDERRRFQSNILTVKTGAQTLRVPVKDIVCLETVGRRVAITLTDRVIDCHGKLSELINGVAQFVRCHSSFAVNMEHIRELTRTDVITTEGKSIPVSRTYTKDVQRAIARQMRRG